jgi:hypothetical protein
MSDHNHNITSEMIKQVPLDSLTELPAELPTDQELYHAVKKIDHETRKKLELELAKALEEKKQLEKHKLELELAVALSEKRKINTKKGTKLISKKGTNPISKKEKKFMAKIDHEVKKELKKKPHKRLHKSGEKIDHKQKHSLEKLLKHGTNHFSLPKYPGNAKAIEEYNDDYLDEYSDKIHSNPATRETQLSKSKSESESNADIFVKYLNKSMKVAGNVEEYDDETVMEKNNNFLYFLTKTSLQTMQEKRKDI